MPDFTLNREMHSKTVVRRKAMDQRSGAEVLKTATRCHFSMQLFGKKF